MSKRPSFAPAAVGVVLMALVASWGLVEYRARMEPGLGGRVPAVAPSSAPAHWWAVCQITRCRMALGEIRWFVVDADTLPTVVCPAGGSDLVGCYEAETRSLTLVRARFDDDVVIRHELMHAALGGGSFGARHDCRYFNSGHGTWWAHMGCG